MMPLLNLCCVFSFLFAYLRMIMIILFQYWLVLSDHFVVKYKILEYLPLISTHD